MTTNTVLKKNGGFQWVDVVSPTYEELQQLAQQFGLHPTSVQDCLQPEHLPKFEKVDNITFMILRMYDETASDHADTVQELTRKIALFIGESFLITIHRVPLKSVDALCDKWRSISPLPEQTTPMILSEMLRMSITSFNAPLTEGEDAFELLESEIIHGSTDQRTIEKLYFLKRKISIAKRMIRLLEHVVHESVFNYGHGRKLSPLFTDLREEGQRFYFFADELTENINNLINVYISLGSHRTNEVMRILTLFSVFFLPLSFIVGIYGMNFKFMPELESRLGYPLVWVVLLTVASGLYLWMRRQGWIR